MLLQNANATSGSKLPFPTQRLLNLKYFRPGIELLIHSSFITETFLFHSSRMLQQ